MFARTVEVNMCDHLLNPLISTYEDWRIPYVGRTVNEKFWVKFERSIRKVGTMCQEQVQACHTIDSKFEQENDHDTSSTSHTLCVNFVPGSNPLVIESIIGSHHYHWHTSSNWQDHSESRDSTSFNQKDIPTYQAILEDTTVPAFYGIRHDYALSLFKKAKSHCLKLVNERIIKCKDKTWSFGGVTSTRLIEILAYAKTFPELFFAFDYACSVPLFKPLIKGLTGKSGTLISILRFVDKWRFYYGYSDDLSYDNKRQSAFDRLTKQCGVFGDLLSMPPKMIRSMIAIKSEMRLSAKPDDYFTCLKDYRDVAVSDWESNAIPDGTFFYFSWDSRPLGVVTPDGMAHEWGKELKIGFDYEAKPPNDRVIKNQIVGSMNDNCEVIDANGEVLCKIDRNKGIVKPLTLCDKPAYKVLLDDDGHVLYGTEYVGYVLRARITPTEGNEEDTCYKHFSLVPFSSADLTKSDKRLSGLALFSYISRDELKELQRDVALATKRNAKSQRALYRDNDDLADLMERGLIDIYGEPGGWQFNNEN